LTLYSLYRALNPTPRSTRASISPRVILVDGQRLVASIDDHEVGRTARGQEPHESWPTCAASALPHQNQAGLL